MVGVRAQGFKQLLPYRHDRIQAGGRLLENNAYLAAPHLAHALLRQAIELNRPQMYTSSGNTPGIGQQTQPGQGDRKSVVEGKQVSVRVDPGGRCISKKKKMNDLSNTTHKKKNH